MAKRSLPYEFAEEHRDEVERIYLEDGMKAASEYLGINPCSISHILLHLGIYKNPEMRKRKRQQTITNNRKPKHLNPFEDFDAESAYLLGYIVGDGCIRESGEESNPIFLNIHSTDFQIMQDISKIFGLDETFIGTRKYSNNKGKDGYDIDIWDYSVNQSVWDLGVRPNKSRDGCHVEIPDEFYSHYVRGLFDSDGCVTYMSETRPRVYIFGHQTYLEDLISKTPFEWKYNFSKSSDVMKDIALYKKEQTRMFYEYIYKGSTISLKRKENKFNEFYRCR